jgi:homogentisate phytyltransferase / homogentisate geranylgeranyltransferase
VSINKEAVKDELEIHGVRQAIHAFWKFSRPHTVIGTNLQLVTALLLAHGITQVMSIQVMQLMLTWIAAMALNIFVVGINQVIDVDVDRINKNYLPLASGEFSPTTGVAIVMVCAALALALSFMLSIQLFTTVFGIMIIGTAYSVPPVQLKKHPLAASLSIATARGLVFNLGMLVHFEVLMKHAAVITPAALSLAVFTFGFCLAIAIMKDIPDLEGDRLHHIRTLAVRMGSKTAFRVALTILAACYLVFIFVGFLGSFQAERWLFLSCHVLFVALILWKAKNVNLNLSNSIFSYYMFIWKMFYVEFIFFAIFAAFPL